MPLKILPFLIFLLSFNQMAVAQFDFLEPDQPHQEEKSSTAKMSDTVAIEPVQIEQVIQQNESSLEILQNLQLNLQKYYDTAFMTEEIPVMQRVVSRVKAQIVGRESDINIQLLNEIENLLKEANELLPKDLLEKQG